MFYNLVKQYVTITLNDPKVAVEFFNGTLFVRTITEDQARAVFHTLYTKIGRVQVSPIGDTGEYAYDFI